MRSLSTVFSKAFDFDGMSLYLIVINSLLVAAASRSAVWCFSMFLSYSSHASLKKSVLIASLTPSTGNVWARTVLSVRED